MVLNPSLALAIRPVGPRLSGERRGRHVAQRTVRPTVIVA